MYKFVMRLFLVLLILLFDACAPAPAVGILNDSGEGSVSQSVGPKASESDAASNEQLPENPFSTPQEVGEPPVESAQSTNAGDASFSVSSDSDDSVEPAVAQDYGEDLMNNTLSTTYQGEKLLEIYALDVPKHLTAQYSLAATVSHFDERHFASLLESCDTTPKAADKAFILFTDAGRHYIYLDKSALPQLTEIWNTIYNESTPKTMHWLTHMTTGKITAINWNGMKFEDREIIVTIADYLKHSLTVNPDEQIMMINMRDNPVTVAGLYDMCIEFDNGVEYCFLGYGDYGQTDKGGSGISVYTSDLDQTIYYMLNEGQAGRLRRFMEEQMLVWRQKNGYPTRLTTDILAIKYRGDQFIYNEDLKIPVLIKNGSEKEMAITTDFVTQRHRLGGEINWEYVPFDEAWSGQTACFKVPAGGSIEIEIPFNIFDIDDDGRGKYRTELWVDDAFDMAVRYTLE